MPFFQFKSNPQSLLYERLTLRNYIFTFVTIWQDAVPVLGRGPGGRADPDAPGGRVRGRACAGAGAHALGAAREGAGGPAAPGLPVAVD